MKILKRFIFIQILLISISIGISKAQGPGAPPPPDHGTEGNEGQGGRAPICGGLLILLGLGSIYGGYKGYHYYQKKKKSLLD